MLYRRLFSGLSVIAMRVICIICDTTCWLGLILYPVLCRPEGSGLSANPDVHRDRSLRDGLSMRLTQWLWCECPTRRRFAYGPRVGEFIERCPTASQASLTASGRGVVTLRRLRALETETPILKLVQPGHLNSPRAHEESRPQTLLRPARR